VAAQPPGVRPQAHEIREVKVLLGQTLPARNRR
jgi:hypothetical protein